MKTQVIHLDPNDDVSSVRDKITWARAARTLLVFPPHANNLQNPLDLRLLQRHALVLGTQIAIVSVSPVRTRLARELGIPIYKSTATAQRKVWPTQSLSEKTARRHPPSDLRQMQLEAIPSDGMWRNLLWVRLVSFSLAVMGILVLLLLIFPSASVQLTPKTRLQSLSLEVSASPDVEVPGPDGYLPAHQVTSLVELSQTARVTGSEMVPDSSASGQVRFSNLTTGPVTIPAGTILRTNGNPPVRFATTKSALIPAGVGKTLDVPVQAVEPGSLGNLPVGSLVVFESNLGTSLSVTNPAQMIGGSDRFAPVQTVQDRTRLKSSLTSEILAECNQKIPQTLAPGDVYFPGTLAVGKILTETYFPADGQTGETLSLTLNLQCQAEYASAPDVDLLAGMILDARLLNGYAPVPGTVNASAAEIPVTGADGTTHWKVQAERLLQPRLDALEIKHLIQGRTPVKAIQNLTGSFQLATQPAVIVNPSWWPWLPFIPFRISLSIGG